MPANFSPTERACLGSQASSPTSSLSFLPSTPPAALRSATARSAPLFIWRPKVASPPVIGPATPTVMFWPHAAPVSASPAPSASAVSRSFFMLFLPCEDGSGGDRSAATEAKNCPGAIVARFPGKSRGSSPFAGRLHSGSVAPSHRARALVEPAVLGHHLGGAGHAPSEAAEAQQERRICRVGEGGDEVRFEQRVMYEAHRAPEQRHIADHMPERAPGVGDRAPREPSGAAADQPGYQEHLQ